MEEQHLKRFRLYTWVAVILTIPAFTWHLGLAPFIGDEAIRSLVALEMMLSDNYLVPTMRGDFYFSKPPLYNWILIVFFKMSGQVNEWVARIPTVIFSLWFTWIIWFFNRHKFDDKRHAVVLAFMFLTCGRMIFYDSFLGLIDIFFSMVTYTMIMGAYHFASRDKFGSMYAFIYALSVVGFMLKGLPTLHFLGFTLLIIHGLFGRWEMLKGRYHALSLLGAVAVIALYFTAYNYYREATQTMDPLMDQATRRTILKYGFTDMLKHLVTYPLENIYHFFPWSLLGFLVFRKDIFNLLFQHKYIWYLVLSFVLNFLVYWVSPEVYPRYILMLIPLIFSVWIYLYGFEIGQNNLNMTVISWLFKLMIVAVPVLILSQYNNPRLAYVDDYGVKMIALVFALCLCAVVYFKDQPNRHILFVIYLLVLRMGFDVLVLPVRAATGDDEYYKREAIRIGKKYADVKLYEDTQLNHITTFYITNETQKITNRSNHLTDATYFIVDSCYMDRFALIDSFPDASFCGTRWIVRGEK